MIVVFAKKQKLLKKFLALVGSKQVNFTDLDDANVPKNAGSNSKKKVY